MGVQRRNQAYDTASMQLCCALLVWPHHVADEPRDYITGHLGEFLSCKFAISTLMRAEHDKTRQRQ